jgi:hypothetical protein
MNPFIMAALFGVLRHLVGAAGAYFVAAGYFDGDTVQQISGAVLTLLATVASVANKKR